MQRNTQMHNKLCSSERRDQVTFIVKNIFVIITIIIMTLVITIIMTPIIVIINTIHHQAMTALLTGVVMVLVICHSPKVSPNLCFSENILCAQFVTSHWQRTPLSQEKHVNQQYLGKQINETKSWGFLGTLICVQIVQNCAIWNFSSLQAVMNIYESYQRIVYGQLDHESRF